MLEEIGHFVDAQINRVDTVGDEGELFSHLVRGVNLTEAELTYIQAEDDRAVIDLEGHFIQVEQAAPITLIVNTTIDENDGSATIGSGLSLRDAVAIANNSPNTPYIIKLQSGTTYALTYVNNTTTGDRSLNTNGTITIETDGTALASIVNNATPISGQNDNNSIIYNSSKLGVTLNNLYISNKGGGRGIYNSSNGILTLTNSTITGNTATVGGGGIYNDGTLTLTNNTISGNTATYGGGIWNRETLTLNNNTISGNTANYGGGIYNGLPHYYNGERGTLTLNNNTISGNTAIRSGVGSGVGGGIDNSYSGILTLNNNTISGNTATYGGGISNGGTLTLTNNIITNNNANLGGGIGNYGTWNSNSIISGNTANQVWYINPDGLSVVDEFTRIDYSNQKITNPIDPKYPNIFDQRTYTALPPTPDSPPKPTISVSNARFDAPAGKVIFEVKLSSAYDKPITVDYYTLDGSANSIDPNQLKDFNNVVKQTLSFFPGQTSKQIEITVLGSAPPTDQTFEILARDTAYRDWTDTDKGKEVDKIYDYSDLGYEGYRINKVFKDSTTGFDAFGLTSDEKFFLVLANPLNANEFTSNSNNLLQDIANTSGGNNTAAYTAGQNLINQLTSANQSYTFTDGTIYDLAKPPVLAIRGTVFSSGKDLLSDTETEGVGYNQFTNNKAAVNQWLSEVSNPVSGLTLKPNITGHSLGGALSQWVGGSYTGQLGKIVTFNSPGISQQPGINFNATNNLGVTHYITSADVVSIAGSTYLNGLWNLDKYSKLTSAITFEKHSVPVLNQTITRTNLSKPTDLTQKVANGNTTDLSSYWFTYLPDADYWVLQVAVAAISPILGAALTYRGTVELNRKAIGSAIDGLGTRSDAVTSAYNAAKSWTSDAWDAIIGQSDKKLGLSPSTANQSNSPQTLASSFLDTNSYEIATTATASQTIDNFWDAIPDWGDNAWQATTKWSADAWKSIDEWTPQTWQATTTWTAADWDKPFLTISNPTIAENNSGTNNLVFKVTLSTTSTQTITINYATANNTATAGSDYIAKTGTLTFTPGQISQDIIISVNGDTAIEPDETFLVNLSNPNNALITDNEGLGTITNDDGDDISVTLPIITLTISPASVTEDGTTNLVYTFTRTGVTTDALTVNYTVGGTATLNTDYSQTGAASFTSTTGTVSFAANSATATVTIDPTADTNVEDDETVTLNLASGTGYTVGTTDAVVGIITDTNNSTPSNQAPTNLALSATTVNENVAPNSLIGTFSTTDPDTGNTFTYSLIAGTGDTDNTAFSIVGNQLQINNSPDFETKNSYSIRVKTTDQGGLSFEKTLTITVNDVNETPTNQAPTDLALSATTVNENVPVNTVIGTFSTTDPDTGNTFTYSLVAGTGDTDNTAFSIVGNQLQINNSPDFETKNSYSILVKTTDQGGLSFEKTLTITVNDVNETPSNQAPTDLALSATTVNENVPVNTVIGTFSTTDPDTGNIFTYSLVAGTGDTDNSAFSIVGNQLQINNSPDFETKNSYSILVKTTDQGGLSFEKTLTITVNDVNETPSNQAPTDLALSATTVNENVPVNTVIGTFSTTDPDTGNIFTYSLVAGTGDTDNTAFSIVGNQLQINNSPDFETKNSYSIRVKTTDQGGLSFEKTLTITVNDVNETPTNQAPTDLALSATTVNENVPVNTVIGTFSTTDPDTGNTFTYSLIAGTGDTDNTAFSIVGNQLQINNSPDFETKNSYSIRVKTTDQGGLSFEKTLTITVNDVNETPSNQAPTDLALSATTVNENVPVNTVIGTFSTTDPDTGNIFTYSLVAGTGDTDNTAFSIVGNQLQINNSPDFETKNSYSIRVKTTDQGGLSFEKTLTITVNDVNETPSNQAPTDLALSATTVNENVPVNTVIGTFSTTDPDTGNTFTYSLIAGTGDTDNTAFSIVGNQLQINNSPDFETKNSYSIRVKTTDQGGLSFEKTLTITVNDVNETPSNQAPTNLALSATTVNENVPVNTVIGTFSSTDPDSGNTFTYSLVAGTGDTDNSAFSIVGNQLQINNSPDFETKNSYSIRVKTTDQGGLSFEKTLTITVNDVNETPSNQAPTALIFQNAVTELAENVDVTPELKVADLLIEDDGLGTNNLFLTGRDRERFLIQNSALFYVGFTPNFEAQNSYEVTVNVDDTTVGVTTDLTQTFTLNITDVNEAPTALILANSTNAIAENTDTSQGVKVADIQISDDALGTNSLSLLGNDQSSFQIRGRELFFIGKADFEAQSLYNLTVAVTDTTLKPAPNATPDATVNFSLEITNLPDQALNPQTIQFNNTGNGQGSLVFNFSNLPGSIQVTAIEEGLQQTGAFFNNVVGLYPVADDNGAVFDSLDLDGDGNVTELIQASQAGYARTALSQAVNNFILRASGEGANQSTTAAEFGDVLLEGGRRYAPFVIANGGNLGESLQGSIQAFLTKNPDNVAATLENYRTHEVAYFSFGSANPDGAEHLRSRGNNIFGFEDLPGNLPNISDNDFNDGILAFNFIA